MGFLDNKVVWITGASAGIGEATAHQIAKEGGKLVLSARRVEELDRVERELGLSEADVLVLPMDVTDVGSFEGLAKQVIGKFGRIDVLFNNAGISQRGDVLGTSMDVYQKLFDVNFFGVVALTKVVLPYMIAQKSGQIAVTSSLSGKLGTPKRSGYCATKHALHGFFDSLRAEVVEHNIHVLLVCPGYINTDISMNALAADGSKYGKKDVNQVTGLSPQVCAKKIVAGLKYRKSEIYMGGKEVLGVYLKRFFPKLLEKIILKQQPK